MRHLALEFAGLWMGLVLSFEVELSLINVS